MPSAGPTNSYSDMNVFSEFPKSGRVTSSVSGYVYECPANMQAKVTGRMVVDGLGADEKYAIGVRRPAPVNPRFIPCGPYVNLGEESVIVGYVILSAGERITGQGIDGSTNGTLDFFINVKELPV